MDGRLAAEKAARRGKTAAMWVVPTVSTWADKMADVWVVPSAAMLD